MSERIDAIVYATPASPSTVEGLETLFLTGPAEFLCAKVAAALLAETTTWAAIFGENINPYKRMDYSMRSLPAMRIYNNGFQKDFESWFVVGDLIVDLIFPANIRRKETQQLPDTITAALLQQFRRDSFFIDLCTVTPGLNELGKRVVVDKSLAFEWENNLVPLTQVMLNFRIDLRAWDDYMESDDRTKDEPFTRPLGDLNQIVTTIQALRDDNATIETTVVIDQDQTV